MSGAFLGLLVLLFITGLAIIEGLFNYIAQFLYIIISTIIYTLKNKHNKKQENIVNNSYKTYQHNITTNSSKNMNRLLNK